MSNVTIKVTEAQRLVYRQFLTDINLHVYIILSGSKKHFILV